MNNHLVCRHGQLRRVCDLCEAEDSLLECRAERDRLEAALDHASVQFAALQREHDRVRELVLGQDDGGYWYSQETMNALVKQRDAVMAENVILRDALDNARIGSAK